MNKIFEERMIREDAYDSGYNAGYYAGKIDGRKEVIAMKHGHWVAQLNGDIFCSYCGEEQDFSSNFCPNCGADMRGEKD